MSESTLDSIADDRNDQPTTLPRSREQQGPKQQGVKKQGAKKQGVKKQGAKKQGKVQRRAARLAEIDAQRIRMGERSSIVSVRVRNLHVDYELLADRRDALKRKLISREGSGKEVVRAVRGISFDLYEGDSVGIVGSNGSGKSTLMSALAGLLPPTSGKILTTSEPKLLGVGAALIPLASGHRNIRIGLLALGVEPDDVPELAADVARFTELGKALDRPLRTYSSGMRARLLFAIATSVRPRILLIDEALAVGDKAFKVKSRQRIEGLLAESGTLVLVSHNMREIRAVCNRVIWLEKGRIIADGPINDVLKLYGDNE
jgi:teichoic acid transport system ATP-binding protein